MQIVMNRKDFLMLLLLYKVITVWSINDINNWK